MAGVWGTGGCCRRFCFCCCCDGDSFFRLKTGGAVPAPDPPAAAAAAVAAPAVGAAALSGQRSCRSVSWDLVVMGGRTALLLTADGGEIAGAVCEELMTAPTAAAEVMNWEDSGGGVCGTEIAPGETDKVDADEDECEEEDEVKGECHISDVVIACSLIRRKEEEAMLERMEGEDMRRKACTRRKGLQARTTARTTKGGRSGGCDGGLRFDFRITPKNATWV